MLLKIQTPLMPILQGNSREIKAMAVISMLNQHRCTERRTDPRNDKTDYSRTFLTTETRVEIQFQINVHKCKCLYVDISSCAECLRSHYSSWCQYSHRTPQPNSVNFVVLTRSPAQLPTCRNLMSFEVLYRIPDISRGQNHGIAWVGRDFKDST